MKYLLIMCIITGAALTDFITGYIKAYVKGRVNSQKMRIGGAHKICELIVMLAIIGLDNGLKELGKYYDSPELANLTGTLSITSTFVYLLIMEIISVLENLSDIFPQAEKLKKIIKKLKLLGSDDDNGP